ncbi:MAG: outer membrane protein [Longimicrobiaceae bacterium]
MNTARIAHAALALVVFAVLHLGGTAVSSAQEWQDGPAPTGYHLSFRASGVSPFSVNTTSATLSPATIRTRPGYDIGVGMGHRFHALRIEGRIMYGRFEADSIRFADGGGALSGYFDLRGATIELLYDLPVGGRLRHYVGAGLAAVGFRARDVALASFPPTIGDNTLLAQQFTAGVSYGTDAWRLLLGYRYLGTGAQDYETGGIPLRGEPLRTHAIQVGTQFSF